MPMKLTILSDNNTLIDQYLLGEPGFSCLIETEGKRFLLDTGYFGIFAKNAETLGLDWRNVDAVVLSHCHDDHTKGLDAFFTEGKKPALVAHPALFRRLWSRGLPIGCPYPRSRVERYFDLCLTAEPMALTENLFYLGAIPRVFPDQQDLTVREGDGMCSPPTTPPSPIGGRRESMSSPAAPTAASPTSASRPRR